MNASDPSGRQIDDLIEGFAVAQTITSMSNVLIAGVYSALTRGLPDAVGFGAFVAAGVGVGGLGGGGIAGIEIVFAPRLEKEAIYVFGGIEPSVSVSLDHTLLHAERGAFAAWYWNLNDLNTDIFGISGGAFAGQFFGAELSPGGTAALLFGVSSDLDTSGFGIVGKSWQVFERSLSAPAMESEAFTTEAAFSAIGLIYSGRAISGISGLAAAIVNGVAVGAWVHYTYGKQQ